MKHAKEKSLAKSMVMIPLYRARTEVSKKSYSRKDKHAGRCLNEAA
jgi:stalled ribosome alternative rescue factor ArfA